MRGAMTVFVFARVIVCVPVLVRMVVTVSVSFFCGMLFIPMTMAFFAMAVAMSNIVEQDQPNNVGG